MNRSHRKTKVEASITGENTKIRGLVSMRRECHACTISPDNMFPCFLNCTGDIQSGIIPFDYFCFSVYASGVIFRKCLLTLRSFSLFFFGGVTISSLIFKTLNTLHTPHTKSTKTGPITLFYTQMAF